MFWVNGLPPGGVIILEFDAAFGRTSVGGVVFNVPPGGIVTIEYWAK